MDNAASRALDPVDMDQIRLTARPSLGHRIQRLLDTVALAVGLIRGRVHRQHPELSMPTFNLKALEELGRA